MNEVLFLEKLEELYAGFGKKLPEEGIVRAIFRRIEDLPDAFMDYAIKVLEPEEKLPANLRWYFNEHLRNAFYRRCSGTDASAGCPRCNCEDMGPGYIRVWHPERHEAKIFLCTCNRGASGALACPSDEELEKAGYVWSIKTDCKSMPYRLGEPLERPRKDHLECLEQLDFSEI